MNFPITPGIVIRGLFLVYLVLFITFSNSKYKKLAMGVVIFSAFYMLFYLVTKPEILSTTFLISEVSNLFRLIYFPFVFVGLLCFFDTFEFVKEEIIKIMKITLCIFAALLIIPLITGTAYNTYRWGEAGTIGWFYSGNQISNIMILLSPFMYAFINPKHKYAFLIFLPIVYITLNIGTNVSLFGIIIVTILVFFFNLLNYKKSKNYIYAFIIMVGTILLALYSPGMKNTQEMITNPSPPPVVVDNEEVARIMDSFNDLSDRNVFFRVLRMFLNNREFFMINTMQIYNEHLSINTVLFGIGFSNTSSIDNPEIEKLIELDVLDGFFRYGVVGLIIMLSPLLITLYLMLMAKEKRTSRSIFYSLMILLLCGISTFSGHTFTAPHVIFYLVIYLLLLLNEYKLIGRNHELKEKITILSLHMGHGGVERTIVNQANMLCEKYEVEIVCLYTVNNELPYQLDKNVKVIYLSKLKPNKAEFLDALKSKKLFKAFKEGLKSVYILFMKHYLVKRYIYNCDSKIIIATRIEFTELLNTYGNKDAIKIAEEHSHHRDDLKYINNLKNSLHNIDYLMPASQYLTDDYNKIMKGITKVKFIPNTIDHIPKTLNKCNNLNIISVGRLSPEKGFIDLIEVFKIINQKNDKIKLTLVGDGVEKPAIEALIKKYKLEDKITLTGFLNADELNKEYEKVSLYLMTSYEESFGIVLIEAMAYGIPCFAFDSALGAREIINNQNGYLVSNRDKEKLANEVVKYFKVKYKSNYIENAKKTGLSYSTEKVKKDWHKFIEEII